MRLSREHVVLIRGIVAEQAGTCARVRLFGSRVDDEARGGDVDLLVEVPTPIADPAPLAARIAGRKVDVLLLAPNLKRASIHEQALRRGIQLSALPCAFPEKRPGLPASARRRRLPAGTALDR